MPTLKPTVIGIRRENEKKFEARVPLIPAHIEQLSKRLDGQISFIIQPSPLRTFSDEAYRQVGVTVQEDLSDADIILCVKEVYPEQLLDHKTYLVFAHVIKGQYDNMPVLQALMQRNITLIDYETITNEKGKRTVFFGRSAGQTGMFETLRAFGQRLTAQGKPCIFSELKPVYEYEDLAEATHHLTSISIQLQQHPEHLGITDYPLVFAFAGLGNVGQGALEIFDILPTQEVLPTQLADLFETKEYPPGTLFKCLLQKQDILRNELQQFDAEDYAAHPDRYHSHLPSLLPYISVLLNCVFYAPQYPRILPQEALSEAWLQGVRRLQVVGDLSCDPPDGSIACTVTSGDLYHPVFDYNPVDGSVEEAFRENHITVMAVDNLSAGLPRDASIAFSTMLCGYLPALVKANFHSTDLSTQLPEELYKATVTHQGNLMPRYRYLEPHLQRYFNVQLNAQPCEALI
jgi:saccharopine dehydrogenase (NAD+, L-lysine-forming)